MKMQTIRCKIVQSFICCSYFSGMASLNTAGNQGARGALIVFEGLDKSGKSTQSSKLVEFLNTKNVPVKHMAFPERQSCSGKLIDKYLTKKEDMPNESIHLLFAVNRWEVQNDIKNLLTGGTSLIVDRYSYSGVAYSVAKDLDFEWCRAPEKGLLRPDFVFFLSSDPLKLAERNEYGQERYENIEFQKKVANVFERIYEEEKSYWTKIDANQPSQNISSQISTKVMKVIHDVSGAPLQLLWR